MTGPVQRNGASAGTSGTVMPLIRRSGAALLGALGIAAILFTASRWLDLPALYRTLLAWTGSLGPWGWALYLALYVLATVLLMPTIILTLGAGAVYGVVGGATLAWLGAGLGATAAFWIGRSLARGWVIRRLQDHPAFRAVDEAVGQNGWKVVALMRLTPALPFVIKNYLFGVTNVSGRDYVLATAIAMVPGIVVNAALGSLAVNLAMLGPALLFGGPWSELLVGVGVATTLALTLYLIRLARAALRQAGASAPPGNSC